MADAPPPGQPAAYVWAGDGSGEVIELSPVPDGPLTITWDPQGLFTLTIAGGPAEPVSG